MDTKKYTRTQKKKACIAVGTEELQAGSELLSVAGICALLNCSPHFVTNLRAQTAQGKLDVPFPPTSVGKKTSRTAVLEYIRITSARAENRQSAALAQLEKAQK